MSGFVYRGPDGQPIDKENYERWTKTYRFPEVFNKDKTAGAAFIEDSEELKEDEDGFLYPDHQNNNATDMTKEEFFNYKKNQEKSKEIIEKYSSKKNKEYFESHGYTSIDNSFKDNLHNEFTLTDEKIKPYQYADNENIDKIRKDTVAFSFDSVYVKNLDDKNQNESYYEDYDEYDEIEVGHLRDLPVCGNSLYIPNAKEIGDYAFAGQGHIAEVYIADNDDVKIGEYAFAECDRLTYVHLPEQLKELPEGIFKNNSSLKRLKLPQELEKIGNDAFYSCESLNFVHVPYNVKEIGDRAFMYCDKICDISFLYCKDLEKIGDYAFANCPVNIKIPDSVKEIGEGAFAGVNGVFISKDTLRNINIDKVFSEFQQNTDEQKEYIKALKEVAAHETPDLTNTGMFTNNYIVCSNEMPFEKPYEQIEIEDFDQFKSFILNADEKDLEKYSSEIKIVLDKDVPVYSYTMSDYDSRYKSLADLPMKNIKELIENSDSMDDFCRNAGRYMNKENDLIKLAEENDIDRESRKLNSGEEMIDIVIPEGTEEIGTEYMLNEKIRSITLPDSVKNIKYNAFTGCTNLEKVNGLEPIILKNVQYGGDGRLLLDSFDYTKVRNEISDSIDKARDFEKRTEYIDDFRNTKIIAGHLQRLGIKENEYNNVVLSNNTEKIDMHAFSNEKNLDCIIIANESSLTEIERNAFEGSSIKSMGKRLELEDGVVKIPDGIAEIRREAFKDCNNIKSIEIPGSVRYIAENAFENCKNLESVKFNEGVTNIGKHAFKNCEKLKNIEFPETLNLIEYGAFENCNIKEAVLPQNLEKIGDKSFSGCKQLEYVSIPESVYQMGDSIFNGCENLAKVDISNKTLLDIYSAERTFKGCSVDTNELTKGISEDDRKHIKIRDGVTKISEGFDDSRGIYNINKEVETIELTDTVKVIKRVSPNVKTVINSWRKPIGLPMG